MFRTIIVFASTMLATAKKENAYASAGAHYDHGQYAPQQGYHQGGYQQGGYQQGYQQEYHPQQHYQPQYQQKEYYAPTPAPTRPYYVEEAATPPPDFVAPSEPYPVKYEFQCDESCKPNSAKYYAPTPAPTRPYYVEEAATPPPDFVAPSEPYPVKYEFQCDESCKPNSAKYMAYVCSSLYASALKWANNNCKGYYAVENPYDKNSLYQARLCTYWTQRSVMSVVTSCFIEAHLRNEFVMKYGKDGPGIWFCRYKEFVNQVKDCYKGSLKYYPLGEGLNSIEQSVANLYTPNKDDMPPFEFTGASVAMCAYYNKDQVYHRGSYY